MSTFGNSSVPGDSVPDAALPTYAVGEKLRHRQRPEWGFGAVTKIETVTRQGQRDQRIWIRFPNAGLKTVLASMAELERSNGEGIDRTIAVPETFIAREARHEGGWLGGIAKRKPEEAMTSLPSNASDPFLSIERRLEYLLSLYRFEPAGGKLIDWAVAQSGLDDPLSRFNRHELEAFFTRWSFERDATLSRLAQEARRSGTPIESAVAKAPLAAQRALRKFTGSR